MMSRIAARLAKLVRRLGGADDAPKALFFYPQEGSNDTWNAAREAVHRLADELPDATPVEVVEAVYSRLGSEHPDYVTPEYRWYWRDVVIGHRATSTTTTPVTTPPAE